MHYCISIGTGAGVLTFTTPLRKDVRQVVKNLPKGWTINIWEFDENNSPVRRCKPEEFVEDD